MIGVRKSRKIGFVCALREFAANELRKTARAVPGRGRGRAGAARGDSVRGPATAVPDQPNGNAPRRRELYTFSYSQDAAQPREGLERGGWLAENCQG